jgi:hypothetical protein
MMPARANSNWVIGLPSSPRSGRCVLGNGCSAEAFTLPLSIGAIGRPSYSSTPPRSSTQARRVRARPLRTSIVTDASL